MRIIALEIEDFGVFAGRHRLELAHEGRRNGHPDRTLVVGHNGSGKSTLLQAASLALYGPLSLGARANRRAYHEYLRRAIHGATSGEPLADRHRARVAVEIEHVQAGVSARLLIERSWSVRGTSVRETCRVKRANGGSAIVGDAEEILANLFPPELRRFLFVDVTLVDELSRAIQSPGIVSKLLRELGGFGVVGQLRSDLLTLITREGEAGQQQVDVVLLQDCEASLRRLDLELEQVMESLDQAEADLARSEEAIAEKERELLSAGGRFAESRAGQADAMDFLGLELEGKIGELRELCSGVLPFALCSRLCLELDRTLDQEAQLAGLTAARGFALDWLSALADELPTDHGLATTISEAGVRAKVAERVESVGRRLLERDLPTAGREPLHDLSERDRISLRTWLAEATTIVPGQVGALHEELCRLEARREALLRDLDRVPDDSQLAEVQAELKSLRDSVVAADTNCRVHRAGLEGIQKERAVTLQGKREAEERLVTAADVGNRTRLLGQVRTALEEFEALLLGERSAEFASALVAYFGQVSRKQALLATADFDPRTQALMLADAAGQPLDPDTLSTGELQLFAMAVLESLRATTGHGYPLFIDTPLAFLDKRHREAFITQTILGSPNQVVLFATDREMSAAEVRRLAPKFGRVYRLSYDGQAGSSCFCPVKSARGDRGGVSKPVASS